ncbi:MAG: AraC family transcriptional regulator ligand-binding domain-containing protein [Burkholderiales bacterium]|nr:AraC family transcriptional regulator ligand-binding domain-containing protein [Burkholderiales bacterium]MBS0404117.1 AraC family transcriptional regulator ligand-binding domain-containing protein [Pseudomonadota bacterium]MBS0415086.1 AraC family transcriptional regulator ligand-binding domain-containing protein [Pseudomonadota bacterium]
MTARLLVSTISAEANRLAIHALHRLLNRPTPTADAMVRSLERDNGLSHSAQTPLLGFTRMLGHMAQESGRSELGLEMAKSEASTQHPSSIFGDLFVYAPTLGDALRAMAQHFPVSQTGTTVKLIQAHGTAHLTYKIDDQAVGPRLHDAAYTLGKICRSIRRSAGTDWRPQRVMLAAPTPRDTAAYQHFFEAPVVFNTMESGLSFGAQTLDQPISTANPRLYHDFYTQLKGRMPACTEPDLLPEALKAWVIYAAGEGRSSLEHAAADFGVTPRTLQRRLKDQGIGFQNLLAQARMDKARQLLANSPMSITRIAEQLGFSETSAFTRAFRHHTRLSPRAFRQTALAHF